MPPHEVLAFNVDRLAARLGINRSAVARGAGMTPGRLSNYLSGKKTPLLTVVFRLATALRVSPSELLNRPGEIIDHDIEECLRRVVAKVRQ